MPSARDCPMDGTRWAFWHRKSHGDSARAESPSGARERGERTGWTGCTRMERLIARFCSLLMDWLMAGHLQERRPVNLSVSVSLVFDGVDFKKTAEVNQDIFSYLTQWSCKDECRYHCMWLTVHGFRERGYPTPKFHGKWPFIKIFGAQEPAAAFCSLLNLFAHVHMYVRLRKRYSKYNTPLTMFWHLFAWVCMNAWIWSTIFHTRDTPFTEFMDYTCALSMVVALFVAAIVRCSWFATVDVVGAVPTCALFMATSSILGVLSSLAFFRDIGFPAIC
ncbi:Post-GPI attachment to proteins factor 3 [Eumeta japonica]|uniref:Post-GPI attachment to proteins factor 3 n=1 Tax=Eumeta variegata TaxID=151549 RepID=A0A4C1WZF5_EUMVA|nr:Post-GPI attachment to proteins factor 3 [Eumeta japonica]